MKKILSFKTQIKLEKFEFGLVVAAKLHKIKMKNLNLHKLSRILKKLNSRGPDTRPKLCTHLNQLGANGNKARVVKIP